MSGKKTFALISVITAIIAAVAAVFLFRDRIASLIQSVSAKRNKIPAEKTSQPDFTDEERESFADI